MSQTDVSPALSRPIAAPFRTRALAVLAYVVPSFPLGYAWHLSVFAGYYDSLNVFRDDIIVPLGVMSMFVQGIAWAILYERLFAGEPIRKGALKFACFAAPVAWSFMVLATGAKHHMSSPGGYLLIETAFVLVHYAIVSPLIALAYAKSN